MLRALLIVVALACFTDGYMQPTEFDITADEVIDIYKRNRDFCKQHLTTAAVSRVYNDDGLIISVNMPSLSVQTVFVKIKYLTLYVRAEKTPVTHRNQRYSWINANENKPFEYVTILADDMDTKSAVWDYAQGYLKIQIPFKARYTEITEDCHSRLEENVITVPRRTISSGAGEGAPDQSEYYSGSHLGDLHDTSSTTA